MVLLFVDVEQYKHTHEANPALLLKMVWHKNYTFIERVLKNGECCAYDIVEKALARMKQRNINCQDKRAVAKFHKEEPFSKLLYYTIKQKLIKVGPSRTLTPKDVKKAKYYKSFAVAAMLRKCNGSRKKSNESEFAKAVLSNLVNLRRFPDGRKRLIPYHDIRNAGASLVFLRYHLNLPEELFRKDGELNCTARQLYEEKFDMLFCLRAGFDVNELSLAGFDERLLKDKNVQHKDENGNWLEEVDHIRLLKNAGFQSQFYCMHFTLFSLTEFRIFTRQELLTLKEVFEEQKLLDEYNTADDGDYISEEESTTEEYVDDDCRTYVDINALMNRLITSGHLPLSQSTLRRGNTPAFVNHRKRISMPTTDQNGSDFSSWCEENVTSRSTLENSSPLSSSEEMIQITNPRPFLVSIDKVSPNIRGRQQYLRTPRSIATNIRTPRSIANNIRNIKMPSPLSYHELFKRIRLESSRRGLGSQGKLVNASQPLIYHQSPTQSVCEDRQKVCDRLNRNKNIKNGVSSMSDSFLNLDNSWESSVNKVLS